MQEQYFQAEDITVAFNAQIAGMKDGDIHFAPGFTLYESMSATELFDCKVDVKMDLVAADTTEGLLERGVIRASLTDGEVLGIFDLVLGKEFLWYGGNALPQTIYTLV
jgi:hypothetical protein